MLSLHTNKTDSSRAVMTRKLEIEKFGENFIFPYIFLLKTAAIYGLTTYARSPLCPSLNVSSLSWMLSRGNSKWRPPSKGVGQTGINRFSG